MARRCRRYGARPLVIQRSTVLGSTPRCSARDSAVTPCVSIADLNRSFAIQPPGTSRDVSARQNATEDVPSRPGTW